MRARDVFLRAFWPSVLALVCGVSAGCPKESTTTDAGTTTAAAVVPSPPSRIVIGTHAEPDTLNPLFTQMSAATEVIFFINRELTMFDDTWEVVPDLAESVPTVENGGVEFLSGTGKTKQMRVTWKIKKDAQWEDGVPVTGDDFVFAWKIQKDSTQEIINRDLPERIHSMVVEGDDRKTLVVTWKEPFAFYHQFESHRCLPRHILEPRYRKPGGGTANMKKDPFGQKPIANGPYVLREWLPGQHIILKRNPRYTPAPEIDEIVIRIMGDTSSLSAALVAGDLDTFFPSAGLVSSEIETLKSRFPDRFVHKKAPGLVWAHIDFNLDDPLLRQKAIRQGIAHAVNREGILKQLYGGRYTLAHTFLPPRHWGYNANVRTYPFDLDAAARLFDEAGYKQSAPGKIRRKGREKLIVRMSAVSGIKDIEDMQAVMKADLKKVGVELRVDNKNAKAFFGEWARKRKFPQMSMYAWTMDPSGWGNTLWQADMIPSSRNNWQGQNFPGWKHGRVTRILTKVPQHIDEKKRIEMMHEVQRIWAAELPALGMFFRPVESLVHPRLEGVRPTGTQTPIAWNVTAWKLVDPPDAKPAP